MSFRNDFFDIIEASNPALQMSAASSVLLNTMDRGLTALHGDVRGLQQGIDSRFSEFAEVYAQSSAALAAEIEYQSELNRQATMDAARAIATTIEQARIYLGNQIAEVRWAIERNTEVTRAILDSLWKTHRIESRQFFEEGVQCYESDEKAMARERFEKAAEACRTNGFAYEYLGFLSVHDNDQTQALRNFELAAKFAADDYYRAIACYHSARAWQAAGVPSNALKQIQTAVALMPEDLTYRFELVRALMRTASKQEALQELKRLIVKDMRYWTAAAMDRTLEPMRAEITQLLEQMREQAKEAAERVQANYTTTVRLIEAFSDPLPPMARFISLGQHALDPAMEKDTVFEYRNTISTVPISHRMCAEREIERYENGLAYARDKVSGTAAGTQSRAARMRDDIHSLRSQVETIDSQLIYAELSLKKEYKERAEKKIWMIWLMMFGIAFGLVCAVVPGPPGANADFRFARLFWIVISVAISAIFPVSLIRRRTALHADKSRARAIAQKKRSEVEEQMRTAEKALRTMEQTGNEEVARFQADYSTLTAKCEVNLRPLRERLDVAKRDETVLATLWS